MTSALLTSVHEAHHMLLRWTYIVPVYSICKSLEFFLYHHRLTSDPQSEPYNAVDLHNGEGQE